MKNRVFNKLAIIFGLAISFGVMTVFSACNRKDDNTWRNCHNAQIYVCFLGMAIAFVALISSFVSKKRLTIMLDIIAIVLAVVIILVPGIIVQMCVLNTMRCYSFLKPFATSMSILIIIFSVMDLAGFITGDRKRQ